MANLNQVHYKHRNSTEISLILSLSEQYYLLSYAEISDDTEFIPKPHSLTIPLHIYTLTHSICIRCIAHHIEH